MQLNFLLEEIQLLQLGRRHWGTAFVNLFARAMDQVIARLILGRLVLGSVAKEGFMDVDRDDSRDAPEDAYMKAAQVTQLAIQGLKAGLR